MSELLRRELRQKAPFGLEEAVVLLLQMAAQRVGEPLARHLRDEAGLTPNQYNVLRILRGAGAEGLPCGEIAERMITRDPDVTRLLDRLVARGLAARERAAGDRRVVRAVITEAGLTLLAALDPAVRAHPPAALGSLGKRRLAALRAQLETVIEEVGRASGKAQELVNGTAARRVAERNAP